jgi:5'-3' exonuclease
MNIVIDGNAFLNVAVSIVKNILSADKRIGEKYYVSDLLSDEEFILKQASKDAFRSFSLNYLGSIFAPFKDNITSVFLVFDSKSWRKKFIKEHFTQHGEGDFSYKGQRKYDDKIYLFFDYFQNDILPTLTDEYGILSNRVQGAEGDDLIAYICENLKEDICIWSVDKDLTQLLESSDRKVIMLMPKQQTKFKKVYTTEDFDSQPVQPDIDLFNFEMGAIDNSTVVNVINDLVKKDYRHFKIDPALDILTKVIAGDQSDNIPRSHPKLTASKVTRVIELIRERTDWQSIKLLIDQNDSRFMQLLNDVICEVIKINDPGESLTIRNNLSRNRTIIRLSTAVFPQEITESIANSVKLEDRRRFNYFKFKKTYKS